MGILSNFQIHIIQRFVSSTGNIEVLLSHTHSIVCDNDIGGLFLGCQKSCQMAAHDLKIHFNFFSSFYIRKYLKCWKEFSHWLRKYVFRFKSMSFCNHWLEPTCFFGFKRGDPNFFKFGYRVENWYEKLSFAGEIAVNLFGSFITAQISSICLDSWKQLNSIKQWQQIPLSRWI